VGRRPLQWFQPETQGQAPPPRYAHCMNYFEAMNALIIFAGRNDSHFQKHCDIEKCFLNDLWLISLESLVWCRITQIGDAPSPRYSCQSAIHSNRLLIFGGLNAQTYNNSDIYICELDPILSKQYEVEKNRKLIEFQRELQKNRLGQAQESQSNTA